MCLTADLATMAQFFVAAGTFALAIATYFLIPKKASLEIEFKNDEPFVRELSYGENLFTRWVRVRVRNLRKVAKSCEGKLEFTKWEPNDKNEKRPDPILLHWVRRAIDFSVPHRSQEYHGRLSEATRPIDIRKDENELLDVLFSPAIDVKDTNKQSVRAQIYSHRWLILREEMDQLTPGKYEITITVFAENADPVSQTYSLEYEGGHRIRLEKKGA